MELVVRVPTEVHAIRYMTTGSFICDNNVLYEYVVIGLRVGVKKELGVNFVMPLLIQMKMVLLPLPPLLLPLS